ncbi:4'-phosphopantetheinyl transferase family protein [Alsobacter soli]|nr:4'-phosphopantetheinyl transferase superfamily protein [Alsobacter soli]
MSYGAPVNTCPTLPPQFPHEPAGRGDVVVLVGRIADWSASPDLLSAPERERLGSLRHPGTAAAFVAGRTLARLALARWLHCTPGEVAISLGRHEKPSLCREAPVRFNLTHSDRHVALALTVECEVGVDIEPTAPPDRDAVAEVVMVEAEIAAYKRLPQGDRDAAFLRLWTRKEAVLKAAGSGFSVDPTALSVGFGPIAGTVALPGYAGWFSVADVTIVTQEGALPAAVSLWNETVGSVSVLRA